MIKKILLAIVIAFSMGATAQAQKFGTVSADDIMKVMPEMTTIQTQLEEASKRYETEYQNLGNELNRKVTEFQALENDTTTPDAIKERRIQEIQELQQKIEQFRATAQQDLQRQQAQLLAPVEQKIMDAIKAVGAENGFTMIFPAGVSFYQGTDVIDVTPLVKTKLGIQ